MPDLGRRGEMIPTPRRRAQIVLATLATGTIVLLVAALGNRPAPVPSCSATVEHPEWSVARRWDEAALDAIRRSLPNPPVHARTLFHLSAVMWDAWAAYDPHTLGLFDREKASAVDVDRARDESISYAAFRLLKERFSEAVGAYDSLNEFDRIMASLCYPIDRTTTSGTSPADVGNRVAAAAVAAGLRDGSNEAGGYVVSDYKPVNPPLVVASPGTTMSDPNRWQPLQLAQLVSQNGIPIPNGVQKAVGIGWGQVRPFALTATADPTGPFDPGPPPRLGRSGDGDFKNQVVDIVRASAALESQGVIDVSPATRGHNTLGANDGQGWSSNPATGKPYAPELVKEGDFLRAMTEYWADGPNSETPPGHWNVLANAVSDALVVHRFTGSGRPLGRLEWDVKLYLALNGALHDAAISAWGIKTRYDGARPISMVRYMAEHGQSSDPHLPRFDPLGLPLVPGLIEPVLPATTAHGGRMQSLAGHEGEIAIRAWLGPPADPKTSTGGVGWMLATTWVPYQLPTFVTPSFPGYISGHSTFSRAAAEVLSAFTGSPFFPDGLGTWRVPANTLRVESGPSIDVVLEWATYFDAADQAGQSRIYGGIHVQADDFTGRVIGSQCGTAAFALALEYFNGGE